MHRNYSKGIIITIICVLLFSSSLFYGLSSARFSNFPPALVIYASAQTNTESETETDTPPPTTESETETDTPPPTTESETETDTPPPTTESETDLNNAPEASSTNEVQEQPPAIADSELVTNTETNQTAAANGNGETPPIAGIQGFIGETPPIAGIQGLIDPTTGEFTNTAMDIKFLPPKGFNTQEIDAETIRLIHANGPAAGLAILTTESNPGARNLEGIAAINKALLEEAGAEKLVEEDVVLPGGVKAKVVTYDCLTNFCQVVPGAGPTKHIEVLAYVGGKAYHLHFYADPDQFPGTSPAITELLKTLKIGGATPPPPPPPPPIVRDDRAGGGGAGAGGGGAGAGGGTTTTPPGIDPITGEFTNTAMDIRFLPPPGFKVTEVDGETIQLIHTNGPEAGLAILTTIPNPRAQTVEQFVADTKAELDGLGATNYRVEPDVVLPGGITAKVVTYDCPALCLVTEGATRNMEVYAYVGGKAYHLHFSADPAQFPNTSSAITSLLSTLKISGAGAGGGDVTVGDGVAGGGVTAGGGTTTATAAATTTVNTMPPTANAGRDATAKPGDTITLDGGASDDPDGDEAKLKYEWAQIGSTASTYPVTLSSANTVNPTFTVPTSINVKTILSFQLTVSDERGGISLPPDTVDITIDP
jgi:hypothetical protein